MGKISRHQWYVIVFLVLFVMIWLTDGRITVIASRADKEFEHKGSKLNETIDVLESKVATLEAITVNIQECVYVHQLMPSVFKGRN